MIRSNATVTVLCGVFFRGCGHSFHLECNLPDISVCPLCKDLIKSKIESLGKTANEAVMNLNQKSAQAPPNDDDDETSDGEGSRAKTKTTTTNALDNL